jgi:hypothetical protein
MTAAAPTRPVAALVTAVLGPGAGALAALLLRSAASRWGALQRMPAPGSRPDELVGALAATGAGLVLCWLAAGVVLAVVGHLCRWDRAARTGVRLLPRMLRGAVGAALGGALVLGAASGALADTPAPTPAATATMGSPSSASIDPAEGLPDPRWTPPPPPPLPAVPSAPVGLVSAAGRPGPVEDRVVVRRGDTLWAIAARHLGAGASAAQVAREWPRWYAANRTVIGPDPDRLAPGQRLEPPRGRSNR